MKLPIPMAVVASLSLACAAANASDIHVDSRNGGAQDGSPVRPYRTVQAAVNAAKDGDRIKIASGTYPENVSVNSKGLIFQGGFPGASETIYSNGNAGDFYLSDPRSHPTELRGSSHAPVLHAEGTIQTTVEDLVITGGRQGLFAEAYPETQALLIVRRSRIENNGNPSVYGGGICANSALLVEDSIVRMNLGDRGSGISSRKAPSRILRTLVENNTSHGDHGGGIYAANEVEIRDCLVRNNRVGEGFGYGWGGGIIVFNQGTNATIADTEVRGNFAPSKGSGVFIDDGAQATLRNVLVADNACAKDGGAVYVDGLNGSIGSQATLINVTITGHDCDSSGYGNALVLEQASSVTLESSILWGNGPLDTTVDSSSVLTVRYSNALDNLPGTGNLHEDPLFANPTAGDFHLKNEAGRWDPLAETCINDPVTSPCVDRGDPEGAYDREPEPNGGRVDMGAYGNSVSAGCAANGGAGGWAGTGAQGGTGGFAGADGGQAGTGNHAGSTPTGGSSGTDGGTGGGTGGGTSGGTGGGTGGDTGGEPGGGTGGVFHSNETSDDSSGCDCRIGSKGSGPFSMIPIILAAMATALRRGRRFR